MILNDADISQLASSAQLLTDYDPEQIRNCAYTLRAHSVFRPGTGDQEILNVSDGSGFYATLVRSARKLSRRQLGWELGPAETLIVITREEVNMPENMCGIYAPLFRLAKQGVMLINASIVEPGYRGPLSCFLANFSGQRITLRQDTPIAKILFHKMTGPPQKLFQQVIERHTYEQDLAEEAKHYHRSFMDVSGIEERAARKAIAGVKGLALTGGILIALLLLWATLEPILSKWIWEKTGFTGSTQRVEDFKLLKDIQDEQAALKLQLEQKKVNDENAAEIDAIKREIQSLKKR
jgi:deoxycytidine triphosphate deaminase